LIIEINKGSTIERWEEVVGVVPITPSQPFGCD